VSDTDETNTETPRETEDTKTEEITSETSETNGTSGSVTKETETVVLEDVTDLTTDETVDTASSETEKKTSLQTSGSENTSAVSQTVKTENPKANTVEKDSKITVGSVKPYVKPNDVSFTEYYSSSLFVGDSICSGLKLYAGLLNTENVAARGNVGTWSIDTYKFQYMSNSTKELDAASIVKLYQPEDIYLWMGMNDIYVVSEDKFVSNMLSLAEKYHELSPKSRIHIVSISPIIKTHKWNVNSNGNNRINEYNAAVRDATEDVEYLDWINIHDLLVNSEGCLCSDYDGGDGLHLSQAAYKKVLSGIIDYNNQRSIEVGEQQKKFDEYILTVQRALDDMPEPEDESELGTELSEAEDTDTSDTFDILSSFISE
jgi:lysophospholipase L1-like esterase